MTLDVATLNAIQAEWMALDCSAPNKEKKRVLALMAQYPKSYLSVSADGLLANVVQSGCPFFANGLPMKEAVVWATKAGIQTRFAWQCPNWIELSSQ